MARTLNGDVDQSDNVYANRTDPDKEKHLSETRDLKKKICLDRFLPNLAKLRVGIICGVQALFEFP